jgi:hypothetical protein
MTEQPDQPAEADPADRAEDAVEESQVDHGEDPADVDPGARASTGHPAVDEVLRSLEGLDGRPVDEHVAAFEQAHEVLRRALSDAGDDTVSRED